MKRLLLYSCCLLFIFVLSCQKQIDKATNSGETSGAAISSSVNEATSCGSPRIVGLTDEDLTVAHDQFALARITNDATNYYITIQNYVPDYHIIWSKLVYGTEAQVQTALGAITNCQAGAPSPTVLETYALPGRQVVTFTIPVSSVGNCFFLNATLRLRRTDGGSEFTVFFIEDPRPTASVCQRYIQYCKQDCPPPPPPPTADCGQLRTQTQGGWGAVPHGNNPGRYLHNNFNAAFPTGLTVGCVGGYTIRYTSAQAITNFLPAGGTPSALKANAVNPADKSIKNVLIGQITALSLSVRFDAYDPNFGAAGMPLGSMIISSGPFAGKTVDEFLVIANNVLGGCSTAYTPQQVNETADAINNNYVDGKSDGGFLRCPPPTQR